MPGTLGSREHQARAFAISTNGSRLLVMYTGAPRIILPLVEGTRSLG